MFQISIGLSCYQAVSNKKANRISNFSPKISLEQVINFWKTQKRETSKDTRYWKEDRYSSL